MARVRDKKLMKKFHGLPCVICKAKEGTVGHHLLTVGARPDLTNEIKNIVPVCYYHHRNFHDLGLSVTVKVFELQELMLSRGFEFSNYSNKWYLPE